MSAQDERLRLGLRLNYVEVGAFAKLPLVLGPYVLLGVRG